MRRFALRFSRGQNRQKLSDYHPRNKSGQRSGKYNGKIGGEIGRQGNQRRNARRSRCGDRRSLRNFRKAAYPRRVGRRRRVRSCFAGRRYVRNLSRRRRDFKRMFVGYFCIHKSCFATGLVRGGRFVVFLKNFARNHCRKTHRTTYRKT